MTDTIYEGLAAALSPQYTLGRELGGGGMSRVYVAHDSSLGRDVVVKLLSPELAQEFSVERFTREIRLAANLQHAHIVPLLSAGATADGLPYYLMPFVEGESLRTRLNAGAGLPVVETVHLLRDVARALAYAHARGVVHRDIKPDNVLLSHGAAVVTDFGIAKAVTSARPERVGNEDTLTRIGTSLGTPAYMAPEQGTGDPNTDHRADIYAFGAMAYELLSGSTPFGPRPAHALLVAHVAEVPVPVAERRPEIPAALAELVMACLAKDPDDRPQTANALVAALDGATTGETVVRTAPANAVSVASSESAAAAGHGSLRRTGLAIAVLALAAVGGYAAYRTTRAPAPSSGTLLAVMPFTTRDATLGIWREGLVDVLSRSLDGVGTLRTVAPSTIIAKSPDRADVVSAKRVGDAVGAGLVVFGDLNALGRDSVRLRASLFDVAEDKSRLEFDVRGAKDNIDALSDSLALRVLRELGGSGALGSGRMSSVGTRSLPALRAFLRGQQAYRRGQMDSARVAYDEAVGLDSTFALGWRGVASLYIRTGRETDPAAQRALDLAIRYKRGVSPRDSLLLRGDSLRLAVSRRTPQPQDAIADVPQVRALVENLQAATSRYPSDAELWVELGDALYHFGEFSGYPGSASLTAFERGIALDSSFIVPYYHASDLLLREGRTREAAPYIRRAGALSSLELRPYYELYAAVLDSPPPFSRVARRLRDSSTARYLAGVTIALASFPDSSGVSLGLTTLEREQPIPLKSADDSSAMRSAATTALNARGKFAEALAVQGPLVTLAPNATSLLSQLALLGAYPQEGALQLARETLRSQPQQALAAARLFMEVRDTASLRQLEAWGAGADKSSRATATPGQAATRYGDLARGYLQLARGDSAGALATLLAVPMESCGRVPCAASVVARLLVAARRDADAARVLDRWLPSAITAVAWPREQLLRGEIAERTGDRATAAAAYRRVLARWRDSDASVAPVVRAAREGLARLR